MVYFLKYQGENKRRRINSVKKKKKKNGIGHTRYTDRTYEKDILPPKVKNMALLVCDQFHVCMTDVTVFLVFFSLHFVLLHEDICPAECYRVFQGVKGCFRVDPCV